MWWSHQSYKGLLSLLAAMFTPCIVQLDETFKCKDLQIHTEFTLKTKKLWLFTNFSDYKHVYF